MKSSKFDPYLQDVFQWRTERKTWREIETLISKNGIKCNHSEIYKWFENRRKEGREALKLAQDLKPFLVQKAEVSQAPVKPIQRQKVVQEVSEPVSDSQFEDWEKELKIEHEKNKTNKKPNLKKF